jgi:hypothetical protein
MNKMTEVTDELEKKIDVDDLKEVFKQQICDYLLRWDSFAKRRFEKGVGAYLTTSRKEYEYINDAVSEKLGEESTKYVPLTFLHSFIAGQPESFKEAADWDLAVAELLEEGVLEYKESVSLSGFQLEDVVEERYLRATTEAERSAGGSVQSAIDFKNKVRKQYLGMPLISLPETDGREKALAVIDRYEKASERAMEEYAKMKGYDL